MAIDLERLREAARGARPASGDLNRPQERRRSRPRRAEPATVTHIPSRGDSGLSWKNIVLLVLIGWFIAWKCSSDKPTAPAAEQTQTEAAPAAAPPAPRAGAEAPSQAPVAELPPLLDSDPPVAGPRLAAQEILQTGVSRLPTRSGLLSIVDTGGSQRLELDGQRLDGPDGAVVRLVHRAVFADREVVTGISGCSRADPDCRPDTPFFVLMREGSPARVLQASGLSVTDGFGAVAADARGVSVDLGIDRGTQWRATLTTRDGIHIGSGPASILALDDARCAEVSLALRECSLAEVSSCAVPRASASQLTAARRNALTRLYNTTTGFNQSGFLALCSTACTDRAVPSPARVFAEACAGAVPAQWETPSLPWMPGAPSVVLPKMGGEVAAPGEAGAAGTDAAAGSGAGAAVVTKVRPDLSRSPPLEAFYPTAAKRSGVTGVATVEVCTDTSGNLRGEPKIAESSGSPMLDAAAVRWMTFATFRPATRDGSPIAACDGVRVRFVLTE